MCQNHPQCEKLRVMLKAAREDGPGSVSFTKAVKRLQDLVTTVFSRVDGRSLYVSADGVAPQQHSLQSNINLVIATFLSHKLPRMALTDDCFFSYFNKVVRRNRELLKEEAQRETTLKIIEIIPLGDRTRLRVHNHGLTGGENLVIEATNCCPSVDGQKYVSVHRRNKEVTSKPGSQKKGDTTSRKPKDDGYYSIVDHSFIDLLTETSKGGDSGTIKFHQRSDNASLISENSDGEESVVDPADRSSITWRTHFMDYLRAMLSPLEEADWRAYRSYYPKRSTGRTHDEAALYAEMERDEYDRLQEKTVTHVIISIAIAALADHREPQWTEIADHFEIDDETAKKLFPTIMRKALRDYIEPPDFPLM